MPYIKVETNGQIPDTGLFLEKLSARAAEILGKPERYIMTALHKNTSMFFAGSNMPTLFMECKSIGLSEAQTKDLSRAFCKFVESELGIPADRVYIEFTGASGAMWGFNNDTF
ncbi:MAG TPA: phenylpyruvate tautomerase MIF-related protein [Treponemataceae bacterium]|jgi:phenylpyruvate tautomerase|nr:MAG: Macrophage migration inhibitory factor (MIF) [Spirochaetes bacterium ADurb.Bin215]HOF84187.1 phenylpyruvate tautomerase MIF-related protein [Treponemataceae bacterium]HOS34284.1 phenylpyruvate tautomerase MIF-related protein [Treponemataceae bacterium]HOU39020.1 phenylpyruvate tautomerase MIF-related protein [Treponemataceae bacterium]HPA09487.1 phenylpyruvate tautomerase MIF-related protein [Treponemataceae bacterium]